MSVAQKLYEGIDLGDHTEGLISYMRTDSTRLSGLFVKDAEDAIEKEYGKAYKGKAHMHNSTNAQDAHEAIRPTSINNTPEAVKPYLTGEQAVQPDLRPDHGQSDGRCEIRCDKHSVSGRKLRVCRDRTGHDL